MPTIKVILNPVSGRGVGQQTAEVIRHTLTEAALASTTSPLT
jgi:diacylglycerol kinase family enzyme